MKKSVYLIDDDEDVRDVVTFALEQDGYKVHAFGDPAEGIKKLRTLKQDQLPGIIIVDYLMPNMNGPTFIHYLKDEFATSLGRVPIALCSALESDEVTNVPEGIIQIAKPMELEHLLSVVRHHCQ